MQQGEKVCEQCAKVLHGRSDQRFCNDTCRNIFNRVKRKEEKILNHQNTPEILKIIKRNYEILKLHNKRTPVDETLSLPTKTLLQDGLNTKFYTSKFTDHLGNEWHCIFERCYNLGKDTTFIQDFPDQAEL